MFFNSLIISYSIIILEIVFSFAIDLRGSGAQLSDFTVLKNYISGTQVSYSIEPLISIARYLYQNFFKDLDPYFFLLTYKFLVGGLIIGFLIFTVRECFGNISYQLLFFLIVLLGIWQGENLLLFRSFCGAILMQCSFVYFLNRSIRYKNIKSALCALIAILCHTSTLLILTSFSIISLFSIKTIRNYIFLFKGLIKIDLKIFLSIFFILLSTFYITQYKIFIPEAFLESISKILPLLASKVAFYTETYARIHANNPYPFLPVIKYSLFLLLPLYFSDILHDKESFTKNNLYIYFYYFWFFSLTNLILANFAYMLSTIAALRVLQLGKASIFFIYAIYYQIIKSRGKSPLKFNLMLTFISCIALSPVLIRSDLECSLLSCIK